MRSKSAGRTQGAGEKGASMVEFALIAPLFFMLTVGTVMFGIGLTFWGTLSKAAHNGVNLAIKIDGLESLSSAVVQEITDEAKNFVIQTGIAPADQIQVELILPGQAGHPTYVAPIPQAVPSKFGSEPVVVRVTAPLPGLAGFGIPRTLSATAIGYREGS
jgi:hypothetical protein